MTKPTEEDKEAEEEESIPIEEIETLREIVGLGDLE